MSALNPLPTTPGSASGSAEKRSYEPSMEDILASIRRIIADDQSLPKPLLTSGQDPVGASASDLHAAIPPAAPVIEPVPFPGPRVVPSSVVTAAPGSEGRPVDQSADLHAASAARISQQSAAEPALVDVAKEALAALRPMAAPQFSVPHGPAGDDHLAETSTPRSTEPLRAAASANHAEAKAADIEPEPFEEDTALYDTPIEPRRLIGEPRTAPHLFSDSTDSSVSSAFNMLAASRLASNSDELMNLAREMIRPLLRTWLDDNLPSMVERMVRAEIERVARGGGR